MNLSGGKVSASQLPTGVRQPGTGGADPVDGREAKLPAGPGDEAAPVGEQHRERHLPAAARPAPSISSLPADGFRRRISPAPGRSRRRRCRRSSSRSRSSTSGPASWRRCRARHRRPRPSCWRRFRKRHASARPWRPRRSTVSGRRAGVPADREDHRAAGGQHRQGHPEDRRPLLHVLPRCVVHVQDGHGSVVGDRRGAEADLRDSGEFAITRRHLCHGGGRRRRRGGVRDGSGLHRRDDCLGLRRLGDGLLLPALRWVRWLLPLLSPVLSDLRVWRVVQPLDWGLHSRCGGLRSLRRGRRRPALQPEDRHLLARCRRLGTLRRAWCRDAPTTRAPVQWARPGRARACTGAGAGRAWRAATTGPPRRDTQATSPATRLASPGRAMATSMPAATATSTGRRATASRSTATAAGALSSGRPGTARGFRIGRRKAAPRRATARPREGGTRTRRGR